MMQGPTRPSAPQSIALCLSGGGLRATFFHLGVVRALKRLKLLDNVTDIISVSGGSIISAHLVQKWENYVGTPEMFDDAQLRLLSLRTWDLRGRAIRRSFFWWPAYIASLYFPNYLKRLRVGRTELLRREYNKFFSGYSLDSLSKRGGSAPTLHLVSTNLKTGGICSFSGTKYNTFNSSGVEAYNAELTSLSLAVAASSAFPPVFPPIIFDESMTSENTGAFRVSPHVLTDGGVYDNTGFESATFLEVERRRSDKILSDFILVSDAGSPFQWRQLGEFTNPVSLALRTSEIIMNRVSEETLRRIASNERVGLISIDGINEHDRLPPMIQKYISRIRTDLDRFSDVEVAALVASGESRAITQLAARFEIDQTPEAVNEFPIPLPTSGDAMAKVLSRSWRVRWWNTFTNFSDLAPTLIINTIIACFFLSVFLFVGTTYLSLVTLRAPLIVRDNTVEQGAPILRPLPSAGSSPTPEANPPPAGDVARVNQCLDAIDMKLAVDEVRAIARRCLQPK